MSVIVKGMDMPKPGHCNECDVWSFCWIEKPPYNMFKSTCPLVALPDTHGRLVDADELKTAFPRCDNNMNIKIASVRATINHMDTIVEAEGES